MDSYIPATDPLLTASNSTSLPSLPPFSLPFPFLPPSLLPLHPFLLPLSQCPTPCKSTSKSPLYSLPLALFIDFQFGISKSPFDKRAQSLDLSPVVISVQRGSNAVHTSLEVCKVLVNLPQILASEDVDPIMASITEARISTYKTRKHTVRLPHRV